jgi:protein gp37
MSHRFHRDFTPHWVQKNFDRPMPRKPSRIFVNSMSDIAEWKHDWNYKVWCRMAENSEHLFLLLSKRPWDCEWEGPSNAMLGYTATCQGDIQRLVNREKCVSFLSLEPLHGPINIKGWKPPALRWIIVGAETGNRKGKVTPEPGWIEDIYEYAMGNKIPILFKESLRSMWPFDGYDYFPQEFPA